MPLTQGCSKEAFEENLEKLDDEGYSSDQAFRIAVRIAKKNMRKCGAERQEEIMNGDFT